MDEMSRHNNKPTEEKRIQCEFLKIQNFLRVISFTV
jgi:hypothetical protein